MITHFSSKQLNQTFQLVKTKNVKYLDEFEYELCKLVKKKNNYDVLDETDVMKDGKKQR